MFLRQIKTRMQNGDTIVEVMIVLAILGLAMSIAYATANRSLLNVRQAQESSEGTLLVRSQIESLRSLVSFKSTDLDHYIFVKDPSGASNPLFCIKDGLVVQDATFVGPITATTSYPEGCIQGGPDNDRYKTAIDYDESSGTFTVKVTWEDILGDTQDTSTLVYRLHPPPAGGAFIPGSEPDALPADPSDPGDGCGGVC